MERRAEDELDLLLDALDTVTEDEVPVLIEAWQAEDEAARRRAWATAKEEIERQRLGRSLDRARSEVGRWAATARSDYHGIGGLMGMPSREAQERSLAAPALLDAAVALLARPALDEEEYGVLSRPWQALQDDRAGGGEFEPA